MKLGVRLYEGILGCGLVLYHRATGENLPGQIGGKMRYGVAEHPIVTVKFRVDGEDVALGHHHQYDPPNDALVLKWIGRLAWLGDAIEKLERIDPPLASTLKAWGAEL